ncbi:MAG: site-specific DNA-methyltransferase [Proteobacteria bacterium]|nr:site-specific DNA-methyltransferase [Pseudomonadota bacterium]MBU4470954.1 site-specific DNA-methyltransferase [Pseudomonadota bacterium]MCG2751441.1 site-specific DNA-methyltransferase [Desulfobacteraceae bacterium]
MKTNHTILFQNANCLEPIRSKSIELVITSPPYPMISMWDDIFADQNPAIDDAFKKNRGNTAFELMHRLLDPVWKELYRVMKPGAIACINIGDAVRTIDGDFSIYQNHTRIMQSMLKIGFSSLPPIIWRKQTNAPNKFMGSGMLPPGAYVTLEHEYILILRKGGKREFASSDLKQKRGESAYFWEERNLWFSDVWMDLKGATQTLADKAARDRSGAFPFELPFRLINMFSVYGDTVLDPFLGLGTTCFAAMASGRNSVGVELNPAFKKDFSSKLNAITSISNERIRRRLSDHLNFVNAREKDGKPIKHQNAPYGFPVITRQEKELLLHELTGIKKIDDHTFEATYAEEPGDPMAGYWGDLFTAVNK